MPALDPDDILEDRELFWRQMHEGFAELRRDLDAWQAYLAETELWNSTLSDGLETEGPYDTPGQTERPQPLDHR